MSGLSLFKGRLRALLTDVWSLSVLVIVVIFALFMDNLVRTAQQAPQNVAVVNLDKGELGHKLEQMLIKNDGYKFYFVSEEEANRMVAWSEVHSVFIIAEDFTDKVERREYDNLLSELVMEDSPNINTIREIMINSIIKMWIEELAAQNLDSLADPSEEEMQEFHREAEAIWNGNAILDVIEHPVSVTSAESDASLAGGDGETGDAASLAGSDGETGDAASLAGGDGKAESGKDSALGTAWDDDAVPGLGWYGALVLIYLLLSGTWMMEYGRNGLMERIKQRSYPLGLVFFWQSLPGIIMVLIGYVIVSLCTCGPAGLGLLPAFIIYLAGAMGIAFAVCLLCKSFNTLLIVSPLVGLIMSLMSGLFGKLPDWASLWKIPAMAFPGHWFKESIRLKASFNMDMVWGLVVSVVWLAIAFVIQSFVSRSKKV